MRNPSTITEICLWNLDKELSDSLDKVIGAVSGSSFGMVGECGVDDVDRLYLTEKRYFEYHKKNE